MKKEILNDVVSSCRTLNEFLNAKDSDSWTFEESQIYTAALHLRTLILEFKSSKYE